MQAESFAEFMQRALYQPEHGYYASTRPKVGRSGDFITSVSVGKLFGRLLAEHFHKLFVQQQAALQALGPQQPFYIIELGANDATLAEDIIEASVVIDSSFSRQLQYIIVEPLEHLAAMQQQRLQGRARIVKSLQEIPAGIGVLFGNELLDAFPVRIATVKNKSWWEKCVTRLEDGSYSWCLQQLPADEGPPVLAEDYEEDYTSEWCPGVATLLQQADEVLLQGELLFIDYGMLQQDYYADFRKQGTLRCYHGHQLNYDPLQNFQQQDITCDVNFSQVMQCGAKLGWQTAAYQSQERFLTGLAIPLMLQLEGQAPENFASFNRQLRQLTHPQAMGERFKVLSLKKP